MTSSKDFWANKNYVSSAIIGIALVLWLASGLFVESQDEAQASGEDIVEQTRELTRVRARHIEAQAYPQVVSVTAQTQANRFVDVRAEVTGQVEALPVAEGSEVDRGEVICRLAVEDRAQRVAEAQAAVDQAQIDYDGALRLKSEGFQSETAIATAKSLLESAKANLLRRQLDLEKTSIRAPFAGVVDERPVEIGDLLRPGDTCATVIDLDPLVVAGEVSEAEVAAIKIGGLARIRLASGENVQASIRYVSRRADDATRTFRVEAVMDNADMRLMSGATAGMDIQVGTVPAHMISASLLTLDDKGELGVRVLDDSKRVRFYRVELVGDASNGVWVTGLPDSTLLITVGHQYVGVGEEVAVVLEDAEAAALSTVK
ncbi:MAG: efflux RND transporter periplasmic adaptor subunit [Cellvibrionaceae bacterium]